MANQIYYDEKGNPHEYNPNSTYTFTDKNGNTFTSKGDNGYVWQAITQGVPISINEKGEWYIEPYLDVTPQNIVAHVPDWFKGTAEYDEWKTRFSGYLQPGINADTFNKLNDILKGYGAQGASRVALTSRASSYGITDAALQKKYFDDNVALYNEGEGIQNASIQLYDGAEGQSAADIARMYKDMSKEDLSRSIGGMYNTMSKYQGRSDLSLDEQKEVLTALQTLEILNHVDDNYKKYGKDEEFKGLLEASQWQKTYSMMQAANNGLLNSIVAIPARVVHGLLDLGSSWVGQLQDMAEGKKVIRPLSFDTNLSQYADFTTDPSAGAYLEGREGYISIGGMIGTVENFVTTMTVSIAVGGWINGLAAGMAGTGGAVLSALGTFMQTPVGSGITDFFLHDVPIDALNMFTTLSENGWDWGKAWENPDEKQNLIAIPGIGEFGPKVNQGMKNDLLGDAIVDLTLPVLSVLSNTMGARIDQVTNGAATRFKESVAIKNLKVQEKITNIPVVGTGWKKMMNAFMGAENANFIREARKASISEGTMDWYRIANNVLTLKNHGGAEEVVKVYEMLLKKMGTLESIQSFQKLAKNYGGIGKTEVKWRETVGGEMKKFSRTVADVLPKQVKQGLLDIERLAELKGQEVKEGGLIQNTARTAEIAKLEARVEKLPQEIKDFAEKYSELNKAVEKIGVQLGITNEEWQKAMEMDPEFEKYMVRQALVPGNERVGSAEQPAILNKGRKGYYADNYIDPTIALNMKVAALGRAHAWNQQAKAVVAMQIAQGKVIAGKGGKEAAEKLAEIKTKIANVEAVRKALDYDGVTGTMSKDVRSITTAINEINELIHAPEQISLKSIYQAATSPAINEFVGDFEGGKIKFGDGVRESVGLTETDASYMVRNTYSLASTKAGAESSPKIAMADNVAMDGKKASEYIGENIYNEGVTPSGVAYRYTVKDGVISDIKEINEPAALANTIKKLGGIYDIDVSTIQTMGTENARAINRAILFYRDNMPNLPFGPKFKVGVEAGAVGWIPTPIGTYPPGSRDKYGRDISGQPVKDNVEDYNFRVENGHVVCDYSVYLGLPFYQKGHEEETLAWSRRSEAKRGNPKNTASLEYTPIHEMGHNTMARLSVLELNREIDEGKVKLKEGIKPEEIGDMLYKKYEEIHNRLARNAFAAMGVDVSKMSDAQFRQMWRETAYNSISTYAGSGAFVHETFSEAVSEVWGNGDGASKFALAIVEQMRVETQKYAMAASPRKALQQNALEFKDSMFKGDQYNFPSNVKTNKQKAQWLAKHRDANPYLKGTGLMTTDQYIKANQWDTFFKKEIESYDPTVATKSPNKLIKRNGEFLEDLANNTAKKLVERVKTASVEGFDENLAMIALGANKTDCAEALDNFIISRINGGAQKLAEKMEGGATEANLNIARVTLWQDDGIKREMNTLLASLSPELSPADVSKKVDTLFKEQSEGFASYEALPVDFKNLNDEYKKYATELQASNKYAIAKGRQIDKQLAGQGIKGDATQTIHYMEGGEDVYVVVRDPVTASILKRPDDYKNNGVKTESLVYAANTVARLYRLGTTGINPIALVRNVLRDPIQATVTSGFNPLTANLSPEAFYHSLRQYGLDDATIKDVTAKLQTWASSSSMTQEIRRMGGETPGTVGYRTKSEKFQKDFNNKVMGGKIVSALEQPMEMWESTFRNQIAQQSFTKAMKRTKGDVNKSLASAMFDASNATTNFSHSIMFIRRATGTIPYLSSAINGTASFWRLFNLDPIGMTTRITAGFMVPVMAITAWNLGSEERRQAYMNLPEWYRDGHLAIVDNEGNIFSLPIPDEIGNYAGVARRLIEYSNEANQYSIPSILAQGAFGFLPVDVDGYFNEDGSLNVARGTAQLASGLIPQAFNAAYEWWADEKLYTGQDISEYSEFNKIINALGNVFGSGFANIVNDIGFMMGASKNMIVGNTTADTLARDLFGMGFDNAKQQFMALIGEKQHVAENGKIIKATGLFKEAEDIQTKIEDYDKKIAFAPESEKETLEQERQKLIDDFGQRVKNLTDKYMSLFSTTGGLEDWQRSKIIQILTLGETVSSAPAGSWQRAASDQAGLDEWAMGRQRYVDLGLPSDATMESFTNTESGNLQNSIDLQARIDRYYGAPKQATQDYKNAIKESGLADIKDRFYDAISKIYDRADELGIDPDYDMIEKIQARYLQSVDAVLVPLINEYGLSILNNNDFIDAVRRQVNGMIPSDDWRQSRRNAKKFLSTKDYPTATVDVKKWLKERYTSGMRDRGLDSDAEVTQRLDSIKSKIDRGEMGAAKGEIESLKKGISQSDYYISSKDMQKLSEYVNMVK